MTALEELVALVNARLPAGNPYPYDPATTRVERWAEHYWSITDGRLWSVWQQAVPQHPRWPVWDPYIVWTEDPAEALERILAVERRRRVTCPACKGRCCQLHDRADDADAVTHTEDPEQEISRHVCARCWDGTIPPHKADPEPAPEPVRTVEDERADVLAWLRAQGIPLRPLMAGTNWADRIERGDHIGAAKKGKP